jgi:2-methylisocitrate lyase-like PEP mutase family enzyme
MSSQQDKAERFAALHQGNTPLLLPNPWDIGSARALATVGYEALATTSSGFAATLGRVDGSVTRDEALEHARAIAGATDLPVSADLENAFGDEPEVVAETMRLAAETGLAGASVEDFAKRDDEIYDLALATERVRAAADALHREPARLVLTARAENYLHGRPDLPDTISRLQAYQDAGADVLYAPGLTALPEIEQLVRSVDRPVNVLALPGGPTVSELAAAGVRRVSIGGGFSYAALGALASAAEEFLAQGTYGFAPLVMAGRALAQQAFSRSRATPA